MIENILKIIWEICWKGVGIASALIGYVLIAIAYFLSFFISPLKETIIEFENNGTKRSPIKGLVTH